MFRLIISALQLIWSNNAGFVPFDVLRPTPPTSAARTEEEEIPRSFTTLVTVLKRCHDMDAVPQWDCFVNVLLGRTGENIRGCIFIYNSVKIIKKVLFLVLILHKYLIKMPLPFIK